MDNRCVCCGEVIPEGRQVCPNCENGTVAKERRATMADCMAFPNTADEFIEQYKFIDTKEEYTNGSELIPVFRVKQMMEHYFATDNNVGDKMSPTEPLTNCQQWIPVTERLPEVATKHNSRWDKSTDSIRVLCACVQADGKKMVKEGYCKVYSEGTIHWKIPGTIHSVTHWMYLPEPPKGE